jgi:hypothetical protein
MMKFVLVSCPGSELLCLKLYHKRRIDENELGGDHRHFKDHPDDNDGDDGDD